MSEEMLTVPSPEQAIEDLRDDGFYPEAEAMRGLIKERDDLVGHLRVLQDSVRRARLYAGEQLPAKAGTGIIYILEKALKESRQ